MSPIVASKVKDQEHTYTSGDCHHFAIALHRLTGAPLVSFCKDYLVNEDERLDDDDVYWSEHAHAAVCIGDGFYVDVFGLRKISESDLVFTGCSFSADPGSELRVVDFGGNEEDLASHYADFDEEIIATAINDAKRWGCERIAKKALHSRDRKYEESGLSAA